MRDKSTVPPQKMRDYTGGGKKGQYRWLTAHFFIYIYVHGRSQCSILCTKKKSGDYNKLCRRFTRHVDAHALPPYLAAAFCQSDETCQKYPPADRIIWLRRDDSYSFSLYPPNTVMIKKLKNVKE